VTRRLLVAAACALAAAPAAHAAGQPVVLTLVDPTTNLTQQPPLAAHFFVEQEARVFRQKVDSDQVVTVGVDDTGRPVTLGVVQRLRLTGQGDYLYSIPAPVLSVVQTTDSASFPGRRQGAILWAGFSPGKRLLGARATLAPRSITRYLPLRVRLQTLVDGRPLTAGERRSGNLSLALTLENTTRTSAPAATGRGDARELRRALAGARRGEYPLGGIPIQVAPPVHALVVAVEAPLLVRGELRVPGGLESADVDGARLAGNRVTFSFRLGDGLPLTRTIRLTGHVTGAAAPKLRLVATPVAPRRTLAAPPRLGGQGLLRVAEKAFLRNARAHQYRTFLLNPGPSGAGHDTGRYVYVTAAPRRAAPARESGSGGGIGALGLALSLVGGVVAVGGAAVAWAHL
jgi:hypothetical protein